MRRKTWGWGNRFIKEALNKIDRENDHFDGEQLLFFVWPINQHYEE